LLGDIPDKGKIFDDLGAIDFDDEPVEGRVIGKLLI